MSEETKKLKSKKEINLIVAIILIIVGCVSSYYAGMTVQKSRDLKPRNNLGSRQGQVRQFSQNGGQNIQNQARPINGEIISQDDKTITVKLNDGSTKLILFSDATSINKTEDGSKSDLKQGEKIMVVGTQNSNGSILAQNIQIGFRGDRK